MNEIYKVIQDSIRESVMQGIKSNTIILNEKYDICREFYLSIAPTDYSNGSHLCFPPMLFAKSVVLSELPEDYVFALGETKVSPIGETLYRENQLLKKYLKLVNEGSVNEHFVLKGVSSKKHKEDFEKIKELINNGKIQFRK